MKPARMSVTTKESDQLSQLFRSCDRQGRGHIGSAEFVMLCEDLDIKTEEAQMIFKDLDREGKGRVTFQDFAWGFREFVGDPVSTREGGRTRYSICERARETDASWSQLAASVGVNPIQIANMKNGQQLVALYNELQAVDACPQLLRRYTALLKNLLADFFELQEGNRRMEDILMREKKTHLAQLHGLEDEVDDQLEQVVSKARAEARAEAKAQWEVERKVLERRLQDEKCDLQTRLQLLQKLNSTLLAEERRERREGKSRLEVGAKERGCEECLAAWQEVDTLHTQLNGARAEIRGLKAEEDEGRASLNNLRCRLEAANSDLPHYGNYGPVLLTSGDSGVLSLKDELNSGQFYGDGEAEAAFTVDGSLKTASATYKVVFAGDSAVGKSCFIHRFTKGVFVNNLGSTLGVDFHQKTVYVDEICLVLQLWDTAGQERFRAMTKTYFRRADGVVLLYDIGNETSFQNVRQWVDTIEEISDRKIPVVLCGNKADRRQEQVEGVLKEDGARLAEEHQVLFYETSSRIGTNVKEAMLALAREMLTCGGEASQLARSDAEVVLKKPNASTSGCC